MAGASGGLSQRRLLALFHRPLEHLLAPPRRRAQPLETAVALGVTSAAGIAVGLAPLPSLLAGGAAAGLLAMLRWPLLAVIAAALAVPYGGFLAWRVGPGSATAAPLVLGVGVAGLLWQGISARARTRRVVVAAPPCGGRWLTTQATIGIHNEFRASRPFRAVAICVALYLAVVSIAAVAAPDYAAAAVETARWVELILALTLAYAARPHVTATALLLAGIAGAAAGIAQGIAGTGPEAFGILGGRLVRAYGTFGQPNPFGGFMNMVWPLGAAIVFTGAAGRLRSSLANGRLESPVASGRLGSSVASGRARGGLPHRRDVAMALVGRVPLWLMGVAALAAASALAGLMLSWSRGAWLAAGAAGTAMAAVVILRAVRSPWRAGAVAAVAAVAAVGALALASIGAVGTPGPGSGSLSSGALARLSSVGSTFAAWDVADAEVTDANFATIERVAHWEAAYAMWAERPWLGQGPGHYELAYPRFRLPHWSEPLGHAHNIYLNALAETGLLGLAAYFLMMAASLGFAAHLAWTREGTLAGAVGLGLLGYMTALAVHGMVDNLHVHDMTVTFGLTLGVAGAVSRERPFAASEGTTASARPAAAAGPATAS